MAERIRKDITRSFNELGLHITIQSNIKKVNLLDVTFNLCKGKYYPYHKPNDRPLYINRLVEPSTTDSATANPCY